MSSSSSSSIGIFSTFYLVTSVFAALLSYRFNYDKPFGERVLRAIVAYIGGWIYLSLYFFVWFDEFNRKEAARNAFVVQQYPSPQYLAPIAKPSSA